MGKSTCVSDLLLRMRNKFDLVVSFVGSAACSPVLSHIMNEHFDPRFFFSEWNEPLVAALLVQQEDLGEDKRSILILVDDVVLNSKSEDQLSHVAMRGRHFGISLCMCAVSYTTMPKKTRRSLDVLMVFSLPMQGDKKILLWEYSSQNTMAEHVLRNLGDHEALVLETLQKKQQLFLFTADLLTVCSEKKRLPARDKSEKRPSGGSPLARRTVSRQTDTAVSPVRIVSKGRSTDGGSTAKPAAARAGVPLPEKNV